MGLKTVSLIIMSLIAVAVCNGQLVITNEPNAIALAQKLVGEGVSISNVTFTGNSLMAGYFKNLGQTNIALDSGIVLTSGRAKTISTAIVGMDGNGSTPANDIRGNNDWALPGDIDLANAIGAPLADMEDACVLEFDFTPSGDTVKFNYVFSSEEYVPEFACGNFNDAFAFFISGPGITGLRNIALVPNTTLPVSIQNINNVFENGIPLCPLNPAYYLDNSQNTFFTHDGHTVMLTAVSRVQPCNTYHLKLVISDNFDDLYDSGVFLEAKSLTSNIVKLINNTQTDASNNSYIVEGCLTGSFKVKRPNPSPTPLSIRLSYSGTTINGTDVVLLPDIVTIPANDTMVVVNVVPIIDNLPEGIETLKIYGFANCNSTVPTDSTMIQIRDYDILGLSPDTVVICRGSSVQLNATAGYQSYQWTGAPGLSSNSGLTPVATPAFNSSTYICTAQLGTCHAQDSVLVEWKSLRLDSVKNVNCSAASTGQIFVSGTGNWLAPVQYSVNNGPFQAGGHFINLPIGTDTVRIKDAGNCIDSVIVDIIQSYPDLLITDTVITAASCSGNADGTITVTGSGGKNPYRYSSNGTSFQNSNVLNVRAGTYTITVKDSNSCVVSIANVVVPLINSVELSTGIDPVICESKSTLLPATTNASTVSWLPVDALDNPAIVNPSAHPVVTTTYYITATRGICSRRDSVTVLVHPAPNPYAGEDTSVCYGGEIRLSGSGGVQFRWSPSTHLSNPDDQYPVASGLEGPRKYKYSLSVTDINGCISLRNDTMQLNVPPPAELFAGWDTAVAIRQPLRLFAKDINNIGFVKYSWQPAANLNNPLIKNPVAILTDAFTQFIVTATTPENCTGIDTVNVKTYLGPDIYVAGAFTPDGDGKNDVLKAFPVGIRSFSYFNIYNRYGQLVFSTTNENIGWDGRFKGAMQTMNTFVWIAAAVDYKGNLIQRKGTTTIIP